jgi:site-specific DNA-adenine methylase
LATRFDQVTIENQDYTDILEAYDDSAVDVLFYADPP